MNESARRWLGLSGWIAVCFLPSATAVFVGPGEWYDELVKPAWTPPSWVFGPVWLTLYVLMGIAAWRVWVDRGFARARFELIFFLVHLIFNAAWTWLFFGLQQPVIAAIDIVVLWMMIVALTILFWRRDAVAGVMLLPYLLWVTYATTLNIGIVMLN
jgi:benzodiazapine receptor